MLATDKAHQSAPAQQAAAIAAEGAITISNALNAVLADLFTFHVKTKNFAMAVEQNALDMTKALKIRAAAQSDWVVLQRSGAAHHRDYFLI